LEGDGGGNWGRIKAGGGGDQATRRLWGKGKPVWKWVRERRGCKEKQEKKLENETLHQGMEKERNTPTFRKWGKL